MKIYNWALGLENSIDETNEEKGKRKKYYQRIIRL
jgi:hypothetical protein